MATALLALTSLTIHSMLTFPAWSTASSPTVLMLRDEGKLQLEALAEAYIPELRGWKYPSSTRRGFAGATC
jgi:hypothetical protein